ncbi:Scr1 family TA system antitoxin-like transcriptional regulator, partial [Prauserella flavalba]
LITLQGLPTVRFGIIPLGASLPAGVTHNFVMKDDTVTIELAHAEVTTQEPGDVRLYRTYLDVLWSRAAEGDDARALLARVATHAAH